MYIVVKDVRFMYLERNTTNGIVCVFFFSLFNIIQNSNSIFKNKKIVLYYTHITRHMNIYIPWYKCDKFSGIFTLQYHIDDGLIFLLIENISPFVSLFPAKTETLCARSCVTRRENMTAARRYFARSKFSFADWAARRKTNKFTVTLKEINVSPRIRIIIRISILLLFVCEI